MAAQNLYFIDSELPTHLEGVPEPVFAALRDGLTGCRIVTIGYEKCPGSIEQRDIQPEVLFRYYEDWYIAAYCYLRQEPRTFRLERIVSAVVTGAGETHGIADEYRKNGIPWGEEIPGRKRLKVYELTDEEWRKLIPPYRPETARERRSKVASRELISAAEKNDIALMKEALAAGAIVNYSVRSGDTALTAAASKGNMEALKFLLEQGADIKLRDGGQGSALFCAVWNCRKEMVRFLVEELHCDLNEKNCHGWTTLFAAVNKNGCDLLRYLLEHGVDIDVVDREKRSILMLVLWAHLASGEYLEKLKILLAYGADVKMRDKKGRNVLFYALKHGDPEIVELLLNAGVNINEADRDGITPLMLAFGSLFDQLLARGADPHAKDKKGRTVAIHHAGDLQHIELLAKSGVDLFARDDEGNDVLMAAPCELEYFQTLIETYGFSVNDRNRQETLLHSVALYAGAPDVVQYLLEHGADANALNHNGRTPLEELEEQYPYVSWDPGCEGETYDLLDAYTQRTSRKSDDEETD